MIVLILSLSRLTNHEMMEFGYEIVKALETPPYEPVEGIRNDFESKVKNFDKALKFPIRSLLTPQIADANKKRNQAWSKLLSIVKAHLNHSDKNTAAIADEAYILLHTYGSPKKVNRKEKSGIIRNLLEDFNNMLQPGDDELIHIKKWLDELETWNDEYIYLSTMRRDRKGDYPKGAGVATRKECEVSYRHLRDWLIVESRKLDNEKRPTLLTLIANVNKVIAEYKTLLNQRTAQINARKKLTSDPESNPS